MKRFRTAFILFIVLLGLGGVATWDEWQTAKDDEQEKTEKRLVDIEENEVTSLRFVSAGGDEQQSDAVDVKLSKVDGVWRIQSPVNAAADQETVNNLIKSVVEFQYDKIVSESEAEWSKYDLENPLRKVTLSTGDREVTLLVGGKSSIGYSLYTAVAGQPKVYLGGQHLWLAVTKTMSEFRDKAIVLFASDQLSAISYKAGEKTDVAFAKTDQRWNLVKPENVMGDHAEILDFIETVKSLKATGFIDSPDAETQAAFASPDVAIEWTIDQSPPIRLTFVKHEGEFLGAYNPSDLVFKLGELAETQLSKSLFDFRDRRIFDVDSGDITRVEVDGEIYTRVKGNWYKQADADVFDAEGNLQAGKEEPESHAHIRALLVDIEFAKTDEFLHEGDADLPSLPAAPQNRISLEFENAPDRQLVVNLYSDPDNEQRYFVRHSESDTIYNVLKSTFESMKPSIPGEGLSDDQGAMEPGQDSGAVSLGGDGELDEGA